MQQESMNNNKYVAILLTQFKSSQRILFPLTKGYPLALFPIGNKKLIVYQLEALNKVQNLQKIIISVTEKFQQVEEFISKVFLVEFPHFSKKIQFVSTSSQLNNVERLQEIFKKNLNKDSDCLSSYKGVLVSVCDTILPQQVISQLVQYHDRKGNSDLSLLLKKKKEQDGGDKGEKKQSEVQTELDNIFLGENDQVLFIDLLDQFDNNGVNLPVSIYKRVKKGSFMRVVDSKVFIFGPNTDHVYEVKPDLIQFLVENQSNKKLIELSGQVSQRIAQPLKIYGFVKGQQTSIKKISTKKIYEALNFESLIRGSKQKQMLLPTQFSFNSETFGQYKGCQIMRNCTIGAETKIIRSCIENYCKIGKKVDIKKCVIMGNVQIHDNCKISDSVIGKNTVIGSGSIIQSSYFAPNCRIRDGSKVLKEQQIPE